MEEKAGSWWELYFIKWPLVGKHLAMTLEVSPPLLFFFFSVPGRNYLAAFPDFSDSKDKCVLR